MSVGDVVAKAEAFGHRRVLLTGGEPLLQRATPRLARELRERGFDVSIETHGEHPIDEVAGVARIVMDVKTPASGMSRGGFRENLPKLAPTDEVKFVIASEGDYVWARDLVRSGVIPTREILFSPALPARDTPGTYPGVRLDWLAHRIVEDRLPVRFQYQLHKLIWGSDARGV
jgi:7-carboxy-7-deazaguanine synthase